MDAGIRPAAELFGETVSVQEMTKFKANCSDNPIVATPTRDRSDRWPAIGVNRLQDDRQAYSLRVTGTSVEAGPDLMAMINSPRLCPLAGGRPRVEGLLTTSVVAPEVSRSPRAPSRKNVPHL